MGSDMQTAELWMKSPGVFAGLPFFEAVFEVCGGCTIHWEDGECISVGVLDTLLFDYLVDCCVFII